MPQRREHLTSSCHPLSETSHYANKQSHSKIRKQTSHTVFLSYFILRASGKKLMTSN